MKSQNNNFLIHINFLIKITINLLFIIAVKRCLCLRIYGGLKKFNETTLPEKEDFYAHLNMEDITNQIMRTQEKFVKILK